jgi:hypothetical protein
MRLSRWRHGFEPRWDFASMPPLVAQCGWISSPDSLKSSTRRMSQLRSTTGEDRLQREEHLTVPSVCLVVDLSPFGFRFVLLWSECDDRLDGTGDRGVDA